MKSYFNYEILQITCFYILIKGKIPHSNKNLMNISGTGIFLNLLLILTTKYLTLICAFNFYFKSAKAIKLKRLNLSNVKKFTMI